MRPPGWDADRKREEKEARIILNWVLLHTQRCWLDPFFLSELDITSSLSLTPMIHCCAHNRAFTAVWSLMAQRGLACSARRDGMHLGSAIRTADLETFTLWLSGHYRRKMVKRIQVREPGSALWTWVMCSTSQTKDWGGSEEVWDKILMSTPQNICLLISNWN